MFNLLAKLWEGAPCNFVAFSVNIRLSYLFIVLSLDTETFMLLIIPVVSNLFLCFVIIFAGIIDNGFKQTTKHFSVLILTLHFFATP